MSIPAHVSMHPVVSSQLQAVGYDANHLALYVTFKPRKDGTSSSYRYDGVPSQTFDDMLTAESVGIYLNSTIKPYYTFAKLD